MKIKTKNSHRGELLQQAVADSGISITQLVKKVGLSRSAYYNHISDPLLPIDTLLKYGKVLHLDVLNEFSDLFVGKVTDIDNTYTKHSHANTKEEAERQRDAWKDKYYELLEKYLVLKEKMDANT